MGTLPRPLGSEGWGGYIPRSLGLVHYSFFSNIMLSSVDTPHTKAHDLAAFEGPAKREAALGQRGDFLSSSLAPLGPWWEEKGFGGGGGVAQEQNTAAGHLGGERKRDGVKWLPCPPCPDLKPPTGPACGQTAPQTCAIV